MQPLLKAAFSAKKPAIPSALQNRMPWNPAYPSLFLRSCTPQTEQTGYISRNPTADLLPSLIRDPKSRQCYIAQLHWYEKELSGNNILIAQIGVHGFPRVDFALECEMGSNRAFEIKQVTMMHMWTLNEKMFDCDGVKSIAAIHYAPPSTLSLKRFAELLTTVNNYGAERVAARGCPMRWFSLVVLHSMDGLLQPMFEDHWAANHPTVAEATEPVRALIDHDVEAILEMLEQLESPNWLKRLRCGLGSRGVSA